MLSLPLTPRLPLPSATYGRFRAATVRASLLLNVAQSRPLDLVETVDLASALYALAGFASDLGDELIPKGSREEASFNASSSLADTLRAFPLLAESATAEPMSLGATATLPPASSTPVR